MSEFRRGQRVEMTEEARGQFPCLKAHAGAVVGYGARAGLVRVLVDGNRRPTTYAACFWRPEPPAWLDAPDEPGWWWLWEGGDREPRPVSVHESSWLNDALAYHDCGRQEGARPGPGQKWLPLTPPAPPKEG